MGVKFIFVTGGVTSSLGKGITAASLGRLLKSRGLKVAMQKFDPYININPGMMSPLQHGEVFVTDDGGECDLDLGHYERFIDENLNVDCDITSGQIYLSVINKERNGDYSGGTVQVIPHITNEIKKTVYRVAKTSGADVVITEIGGTVGDIESQPFLEAARQIRWEMGASCMFIHVTLVPYLSAAKELKTKPTQHSVKVLRSLGIAPDIIVCRCELPLSKSLRDKIGLFCNLDGAYVIANYDAENLYDVPLMLHEEGLDELVCQKLHLETPPIDLAPWRDLAYKLKNLTKKVKIALVGKYVDLHDAYLSVTEALTHAGLVHDTEVEIEWIASGDIDSLQDAERLMRGCGGLIVPGGFGERGMSGMILAIQYARQNGIPFFGIGLGMQLSVVEFARNVMNLDADTTERNVQTPHPIIDLMADHKALNLRKDDTMRLGTASCSLSSRTRARAVYEADSISERHRHRYELNPEYVEPLEEAGLVMAGINPALDLVEIVELPASAHPWFVGTQFHAEFTSRPNRPHPLFVSFIEAALHQACDH